MNTSLAPGFVALHGNRSETLLAAVAHWLAQHPLAPLEAETILTQSNGMAEWVKMSLAQTHGICAAVSVQLPVLVLLWWFTLQQESQIILMETILSLSIVIQHH